MNNLKLKKTKKITVAFALAIAILGGSAQPALAAGCGQWYIASVSSPTCPRVFDCGPGSGLRSHMQYKNMERKCVSATNVTKTERDQKRVVLGCC